MSIAIPLYDSASIRLWFDYTVENEHVHFFAESRGVVYIANQMAEAGIVIYERRKKELNDSSTV